MCELGVSSRAVDRYVDRVKPGMGIAQARGELFALIAACGRSPGELGVAPAWAIPADPDARYLEITDGVCCVVKNEVVVTVVTRGRNNSDGNEQRRRNRHARKQRQLKRRKERLMRSEA